MPGRYFWKKLFGKIGFCGSTDGVREVDCGKGWERTLAKAAKRIEEEWERTFGKASEKNPNRGMEALRINFEW